MAAAKTTNIAAFERKRPIRKPFPEHLPRERVVIPSPCSCPACGGTKLSKLGEDVTETLEVIPRQWKVIQTVREKFSCRDCEVITQPPCRAWQSAGRAWPRRRAEACRPIARPRGRPMDQRASRAASFFRWASHSPDRKAPITRYCLGAIQETLFPPRDRDRSRQIRRRCGDLLAKVSASRRRSNPYLTSNRRSPIRCCSA